MSATLSANVTAGKSGGGSVPVYLLELRTKLETYRWSYRIDTADFPTAWTGPAFVADRIVENGLGRITRRCDITFGGNVGEVGNFSFKIANADLYVTNLIAAGEIFDNAEVEVRLIFADKTAPSWANALPLFNGFVEAVDPIGYDYAEFKCVGSFTSVHRTLPQRSLTKAEFGDELPDANAEQPLPFWYGDYTRGTGVNKSGVPSNISPGGSQIIHRDYAPVFFVQPFKDVTGGTTANDVPVISCGHDTHTFPLTLQDADKFIFDMERRCWLKVWARFSGDEAFEARYTGITTQAAFAAGRYRTLGIVPLVDDVLTSAGTENPTYAVDETDSNYTTLDANAEIASYAIPSGMGHDNPAGASLYLKYWIDAVSRSDDKVQIQVRKDGTVIYAYTDAAAYGSLQSIDLSALSTWDGNFDGVDVQLKYVDVGGHDSGCKFRIRAVYFVTYDASDLPADVIYDTGKGRMYGEWIDGPDCSNAYDEGDLIENPGSIIESLLCDELGRTVRMSGAALQCNDTTPSGFPFLRVAHAAELAITAEITIEFWVKMVSASVAEHTLVFKTDAGYLYAAPYRVAFTTARKIRYYVGNGSGESYIESPTLSYGQWYHVVCKSDGPTLAGGMAIYIDGVQVAASSVLQTIADGGSVLDINLGPNLAIGGGGAIYDEVRIWNVGMTAGQIGTLYNGGNGRPKPYLASNCVAWWRFDEELRKLTDGGTPGGAFTITDSSGNGNTASSNNHANMRYVTGASCHVNYTDSEVYEYGGVSNLDHSFDNVGANLSDWRCARHSARDRQNSRDWIREIAQQCGFAYHQRFDGRDTVSRIDARGTPATIGLSQQAFHDNKPTFRAWQGKLTDVCNEFVLNYHLNHATGEYEDSVYVLRPDQTAYSATYTNLSSGGSDMWNLCHAVHTNYGFVRRREINASWIRDQTTAEYALQFVIRWLTRRPWFCSFEAPLDLVDLELLDARLITNALLPSSLSGDHWRIVEHVTIPTEDRLALIWQDVGQTSFTPS